MVLHNRRINNRLRRVLRLVSHRASPNVIAHRTSFIIPDFPHTTRWLTPEERALATKRLQYTSGSHDTERGSLWSGVKMAVLDYKVWLLSLIIVPKTSAGAVTSFIPTLVATFNYSKVNTLLLVAPPYVFATLIALAVSYGSDKRSERCFHIAIPIFFGMASFIIAASTASGEISELVLDAWGCVRKLQRSACLDLEHASPPS